MSEKFFFLLRIIFQIVLFVIFLAFFGFPSYEKYLRKETVIISTEELTDGFEPPALTISAVNKRGIGWKRGSDTWASFHFEEHCSSIGISSLEECVEQDTYILTDIVKGAQFGSANNDWILSPLNSSLLIWNEALTKSSLGKYFTLKPKRNDEILLMFLKKDLDYLICVHDPEFFLVNVNHMGPPTNCRFYKHKNFHKFAIYLENACKMWKKNNFISNWLLNRFFW